jgi:hypothetical protein
MIEQISKQYISRGHADMTKVLEKHRNTKVVVLQASSYIASFLLGVIPPLSVGYMDTSRKDQIEIANLFEKITLVFLPLQGFFNFVIFVSSKVYNYHRICHDMSICQIIALLFCTSAHDPCFISRISVVMKSENDGENVVEDGEARQHHVYYDVEMKDESNDEELNHRLKLINYIPDIDNPSNCPGACKAEEGPNSEGPFHRNLSSDTSSGAWQKGDDESCDNPSSLLQCSSRNSFMSNSILYRSLSGDEDLSVQYKAKKTYYVQK